MNPFEPTVESLEVEIKRLTIENQQLRETLRDKFAMAAMGSHLSVTTGNLMDQVRGVYEVADAMLAARK